MHRCFEARGKIVGVTKGIDDTRKKRFFYELSAPTRQATAMPRFEVMTADGKPSGAPIVPVTSAVAAPHCCAALRATEPPLQGPRVFTGRMHMFVGGSVSLRPIEHIFVDYGGRGDAESVAANVNRIS